MQWWRAALAALSLAAAAAPACGGGGGGGPGGADWQRGLLNAMGLKRRPRSNGPVTVPDAMRNLYNQLTSGAPFLPDHQREANTVRSFTHQESPVDRRFKGHDSFRLVFNVTLPDEEWLKVAELVIARDAVGIDSDSPGKHQVLVYDILKPGVKGESKPTLRLLDSKRLRGERSGEVTLDVTGATERWIWRPQENHGLLVQVVSPPSARKPHVRLRRSADDSPGRWRARQPVLLAYTDDGKSKKPKTKTKNAEESKSRTERAAPHRRPHRRKDGRNICQRRALYVDFTDVGWNDWIVAPLGYDAYFCNGECPYPLADHMNASNHAIVQTLVNSVNPNAVPKACCVPTDLSSISMLYLDENKLVLKNYQDMAVVSCGCQ